MCVVCMVRVDEAMAVIGMFGRTSPEKGLDGRYTASGFDKMIVKGSEDNSNTIDGV